MGAWIRLCMCPGPVTGLQGSRVASVASIRSISNWRMLCLYPALNNMLSSSTWAFLASSQGWISLNTRINFIHRVLPLDTAVNLVTNVSTIQYPAGYGQNSTQALHGRYPKWEIDWYGDPDQAFKACAGHLWELTVRYAIWCDHEVAGLYERSVA